MTWGDGYANEKIDKRVLETRNGNSYSQGLQFACDKDMQNVFESLPSNANPMMQFVTTFQGMFPIGIGRCFGKKKAF